MHKLRNLVIDASYVDKKKRGIFDMKETQQPLMQLLHQKELKSRYIDYQSQAKLDLLFY